MARRFLRLAYWFAVATAATTVATVVIAYSVGARPLVFGDDDVARYLADNGPVAGSPQRPASPGSAAGGAGHDGGTSGAAGGVTGGTAPDPAAPDPGAAGAPGNPAGGGDPAGGGAGGGTPGPNPGSGNPNPAPQPTTSAPGLLNSSGGSVVVTCTGTDAFLQTWTPKPGYRAEVESQGPAAQASIKFKSDTATSFLVTITCPQGLPTLSEQVLSDHGGPGKGGGGEGG